MVSSPFRAPEGAVRARFKPEFRNSTITDEYKASVDHAIADEIGWIIGKVPNYASDKILNGQILGGEYYPQSGQIVVSDEHLQISFPHEKLHWLSKHKIYNPSEMPEILTGSRVFLPKTREQSLHWLSEAIISETAQRVLSAANIVRPTKVIYSRNLGTPFAKYIAGWEDANVRRVGDYFKNEKYSKYYGEPFRMIYFRMKTFFLTSEGKALYESVKEKYKLPNLDRSSDDEKINEVVMKIFQLGEFSFEGNIIYQFLNQALGKGNLKKLVHLSIQYDGYVRMALDGNPNFDEGNFNKIKDKLFQLMSEI